MGVRAGLLYWINRVLHGCVLYLLRRWCCSAGGWARAGCSPARLARHAVCQRSLFNERPALPACLPLCCRELLEAESNVQLTTTNPADPPAQPRQQMTIRPAAGGPAYQAMAALMKQRQAALRGNSGDPQCGEGPSAGGAPGGAPAASPFAAPPPWAAPPAVLEGAPTPDGAPAPGLVQGVQSA